MKLGQGTLTLSPSTGSNTYRGNTVVASGTLQVGVPARFPLVHPGHRGQRGGGRRGSADLDGNTPVRINGLTGSGTIKNSDSGSGACTLAVGDNEQTSQFSGTVDTPAASLTTLAQADLPGGTLVYSGELVPAPLPGRFRSPAGPPWTMPPAANPTPCALPQSDARRALADQLGRHVYDLRTRKCHIGLTHVPRRTGYVSRAMPTRYGPLRRLPHLHLPSLRLEPQPCTICPRRRHRWIGTIQSRPTTTPGSRAIYCWSGRA